MIDTVAEKFLKSFILLTRITLTKLAELRQANTKYMAMVCCNASNNNEETGILRVIDNAQEKHRFV